MNINFSIDDNFSSYLDKETGVSIFADTFDNYIFDIRVGTANKSFAMGTINAENNKELNKKITELFEKYRNEEPSSTRG